MAGWQDLRTCASHVWRPGLGDPTIGGLALTVLYILASLLFLRVVLAPRAWLPREQLLWGTATVVMILLTVNKQLDLQHFLNGVGRCMSYDEGWAQYRTWVQRIIGTVLIAGGLAVTIWFLRYCREALAANGPLILGIVLIALFVALQIARFEALLGLTGESIKRLRLHRILEGIALLALIRAGWLRGARRSRDPD